MPEKQPKEPKPRKDQAWQDLCEYVKKEILRYPDDMKFPRNLAIRLKGLERGQFIANNNIKIDANYSHETMLIVFKALKYDILNAISNTEIKDERHLINLVMKIAESQINNIVTRIKNAEKSKEKVKEMELDNMSNEGVEYKSKKGKEDGGNKLNDKLKELW